MIIYKCKISGDELFSDIYKMQETHNGLFFEVEGKRVTRTEGIDDALIGGNASAEEVQECNETTAVSGIDVVLNHKLVSTNFDKKAYQAHIKEYVKAIKAKLQESAADRVDGFVAAVTPGVKAILANFKNYEFFIGESMIPEGMVVLMDYREDGITPFFIFFKDGLEIEKC